MAGAGRISARQRLSAARHPVRRDGAWAVVLFILPLAVAAALLLVLALVRGAQHVGSGFVLAVVGIAVALSVGLPASWLAWVGARNASKPSAPDGLGLGAVVAIDQVVYQPRREVAGKPVRLADPPLLLAGREDLLDEMDARLSGGDGSQPRTVVLCGLGGWGRPARRWRTRTGTWPRSAWPGNSAPRTRPSWRWK